MLADVNEVVPLGAPTSTGDAEDDDGGQWHLHDYVVEVMGSECLHFMRVDTLLREGDEVVIRPLDHEDISARVATGRRQVTDDGTYLIDGVPWGKSRLELKRTTVSRPSITIPPRNKRRRLEGPDRGLGEVTDPSSLLNEPTVVIEDVNHRKNDAQKSEKEPAMAQDNAVIEETQESNAVVEGDEEDPTSATGGVPVPSQTAAVEESVLTTPPTVKRHKTTHVASEGARLPDHEEENQSEDSSSKYSSEDETLSSSEDESSDDSSDSGSESDSDSSSESESDSNSDSSSDTTSSSSSSSSSSSDSDSDSSSGLSSVPKLPTSKKKGTLPKSESSKQKNNVAKGKVNPPGHGTLRTKHGNLRTKWRRRLIRLKIAGILDKDANFEDMRAWENGQGGSEAVNALLEAKEQSEFERKREQLLRDIDEGGIEVPSPSEKRRKHKETPSSVEVDCLATSTPAKDKASPVPDGPVSVPARQSKLDIDSTRRLLFGSLGVKTPKTKEDEEKTRAKLAQKSSLTPKATPKEPECVTFETSEEVLQPIQNWQAKITLKATECFYDGVKLSTPPFPFVQRWDSNAQAVIQELRASQAPQSKKKKKNKRKRQSQSNGENEKEYPDEPGQNENHSNEDITLDYGDETGGLSMDVSLVAETQPKAKSQSDKRTSSPENQGLMECRAGDLPPLPKDMSTLPNADKTNLLPGAIFAFKQLDVSKATNWQPQVSSYRTAIVENVNSANTITFRLAQRDRDVVESDDADEGQPRSYTKFEMPGFDDVEEEDDGLRELEIQNLIDAKLISAAPRVSASKIQEQLADIEEELVRLQEEQVLENLAGESINLASEVSETQNVRITENAPNLNSSQPEDIQVSSPSRREISQLIKDAGFRSSVNSELAVPDRVEVVEDSCPNLEHKRQDDSEGTVCDQSPKDQTVVQRSVALPRDAEKQDAAGPREDSPVVESPKFTGFDYDSPPKGATEETPAEPGPRKSPTPPVNSTVPETAKPSPLSALEDWISAQGSTHGSEKGKNPEPPNNPDETDDDDDSGDSNPNSLVPNPFYEIDNLSENDPTPSLEELLAEATPCPPVSLKPPPAAHKPAGPSSPLPTANPSVNTQDSAAKSTSPPSHEDELLLQGGQDAAENNEPSASQIPDGSIVVDLTLSSDPGAGGDDDYVDEGDDGFEEDSSLFHGPGVKPEVQHHKGVKEVVDGRD
ncbi:conserved hypothetical protein [Trichophyton verrucosum HKI 0517]|uniref:DUF7357 domain-containing protein n=1 Tax=Trichophyton verrucosum (strain HKI 0517) TaxID=663202 RepID=D4DDT8_TRIVH|nr:uncharacterized protein TRV_05300 [Trichophyton verrucosum HKI 0517]EFE39980.1 conserved hypothetical protein [Trichophyton verrucosum HKI 0517]